jgi:hypothetical protein
VDARAVEWLRKIASGRLLESSNDGRELFAQLPLTRIVVRSPYQ